MTAENVRNLAPGWAEAPLGALGEYINGRGFKKSEWRKNGRPIVRIQDLTGSQNSPNFFDGSVEDKHVVRPGDLLISWAATLGAYIWRGPEGVLNQHIFKVQTFIDKRFHHLLVQHVLADMQRRTHGTGMVHITKGEFDRTIAPVPPFAEQARIADAVDEIFSDLDASLVALERVRAKLKLYRASVLKAAVEGALTAGWRAQHPHVEPASDLLQCILAERRRRWEEDQLAKFKAKGQKPPNWKAKYKEPVAADTADLPSLPQGWCWVMSEQVCEFITKGTTPPGAESPSTSGEIPFIKVQHLSNTGSFHFTESPSFISRVAHSGLLARSKVFPGDVLMNIVGPPLGQVSMVPSTYAEWNINQAIAIFRVVPGISNRYLALCLLARPVLARALLRAKTTAGQVNLTLAVCRDLALPLPSSGEQAAIVEAVEDQLSVIDHLEADLDAKVKSAQALRQAILRHAFSGRLVPQDPNDEPASELLKRIATEREARAREAATAKNATRRVSAPGRRGRPRKIKARDT